MIDVELVSKADCHLCDEARDILERVRSEVPFQLRVTKLTPDDPRFEQYKIQFPVILINGEFGYKHRVPESVFRARLKQLEGIGA